MSAFLRAVVGAVALARGFRHRASSAGAPPLLPDQPPRPGAELQLVVLLLLAACAGVGFVAGYALEASTQALGLCLGLAFAFLAVASVVTGKMLVPQERLEERRSTLVHPREERDVVVLLQESDKRITRKKLVYGAAGAAGASLGAALLVPLASLGPVLDPDELLSSPWRGGRRLLDEAGRPISAADLNVGSFLTAFAEGADPEQLSSSLAVVRVDPEELAERRGWAAGGILAFSKICPHAGCAVSEFRYPLFAPHAPGPALVCPCHYSTFDVLRAGRLIFGPAGRPLPQLPLAVDTEGHLRAAGSMSGAVGPSWWGVRRR